MGAGCSRPTDRFSQYQKIHNSSKKPSLNSTCNQQRKFSQSGINQSDSDPRKVIHTIKQYTSNVYYDHLKKRLRLKILIPFQEKEAAKFPELIEELRLYLEEVLENSGLAGILDPLVIMEAKKVLLMVYERINMFRNQNDQIQTRSDSQMYRILLLTLELYHMVKFLKDEGLFQEGKWWDSPDQEHIANLGAKIEKILSTDQESLHSSNSEIKLSSESEAEENIIKASRLKKWEERAKMIEESVNLDNMKAPERRPQSPTIVRNLQKPEFLMNVSQNNKSQVLEKRNSESNGKQSNRNNIELNMSQKNKDNNDTITEKMVSNEKNIASKGMNTSIVNRAKGTKSPRDEKLVPNIQNSKDLLQSSKINLKDSKKEEDFMTITPTLNNETGISLQNSTILLKNSQLLLPKNASKKGNIVQKEPILGNMNNEESVQKNKHFEPKNIPTEAKEIKEGENIIKQELMPTVKKEIEDVQNHVIKKEKINKTEEVPLKLMNETEDVKSNLINTEKISDKGDLRNVPTVTREITQEEVHSNKKDSFIEKIDKSTYEMYSEISDENSSFRKKFKEAQRISRLGLEDSRAITEEPSEDYVSPRKVTQTSFISAQNDNQKRESLADFLKEARENISEVIELLATREKNLQNSLIAEKIENELEVIEQSRAKMRKFEDFLKEIEEKPFTVEIIEDLRSYLVDLRSIRQVIFDKYSRNIHMTSSEHEGPRPSIENMSQFQNSLDNVKSKIRESMNSLAMSRESGRQQSKKKARDIEDIEREFEREVVKMRSIHRKDSFQSNCESLYSMLDEACQNIESLRNKGDTLNKELLTSSVLKVENSQQSLRILYEKLLEKHEQIIYEDLGDCNLKVIRNTQDQLTKLKDYLQELNENR